MKNIGTILKTGGLLLMATALTQCSSCTDKQQSAEKPQLMATAETSWQENPNTEGCKLYADYPTDSTTALSQNIREWMNETLGGTYTGNLNDGQKMLEYYGQQRAEKIRQGIAEFGENSAMGHSAYYVQIRNKFETEKFVTYTSEIYEYSGGAHGGEVEIGGVFRKSDGRRFGWDMFTEEGKTALRDLIKEELKTKYFKVKTDEEFYSMLLAENARYIFPLPETDPICMRSGVKFVYQQYEIAPYAAGIPFCVIPYEKLTDLYTVTVRPLIVSTTDEVATKLSLEKHLQNK